MKIYKRVFTATAPLALLACATDVDPSARTAALVASVEINQHGYSPKGPKQATVVTKSRAPFAWVLKDASDTSVATGQTSVFGDDPASGQHVHTVDFSGTPATGKGFVLSVGGVTSHPFDMGADTYGALGTDALSFFYHQRASIPIEAEYVGERWARPTAHDPDMATCYGPEDVHGNNWGGCPYTLDVSKGWYDAGDQGKYVVNGGISVWTLMNYHESFPQDPAYRDGAHPIPEAGNGVSDLLDEARWEMEFMLAMQVPEGTTLTLPRGNQYRSLDSLAFSEVEASGLVHHKMADERWTALPMPPHLDPETRYLHYPSTSASLNLAASAAQCARIWEDIDAAFAAKCLDAARRAYAAAKRWPDLFPITVTDGGSGGYGDGELGDEFYWAATELYITTGEKAYRDDMMASPFYLAAPLVTDKGRDISWGSVETIATISLVSRESGLPAEDRMRAEQNLIAAADRFLSESEKEGYGVPFSRSYTWGSNGDMSNRGLILGVAYRLTGDLKYRDGMVAVLDYLLGRNPLGQSYVAGYGENPMKAPHHRFWLAVIDDDLPPPPPGALAGGANKVSPADDVARKLVTEDACAPQMCYADDYRAYALNEVAINWNAPFFWIASAERYFGPRD